MADSYTPNLKLKKPGLDSFADIAVINANMDVIDAEVTQLKENGIPGTPGENGVTPHIGENGNWWVGDTDTGTPARGPKGENGDGAGTVTGVKIGDTVYEPDDTGVVELENVGGDSLPAGGAAGQILAKKTGADGDAEWVDPPEGTLKSVCGKEADEEGDVDLTASDVGAVSIPNEDDPTYGVATGINADMLGGVPASSYAKKSDIPASGVPAHTHTVKEITDWPNAFPPAEHSHDLPVASANTLGAVKIGSGLSVAADGTISASGSGGVSLKLIRDITMNKFEDGTHVASYYGWPAGITKDNVAVAAEVKAGTNLSIYLTYVHIDSGGGLFVNVQKRLDNASDPFPDSFVMDHLLYI